MATNHTEKYGLHLWEANDAFLRTEFNENTEMIERAIQQTFSQAFSVTNPPFVLGSFVGDGKNGREINLGFHPRFVLAMGTYTGYPAVQFYTDEGMWSVSVRCDRDPESHLTERGFFINSQVIGNSEGYVIPYIAFR